jgi:AcrR family transcriptional regulator
MTTTLQPGEHLLSAAIVMASRRAAETGRPPCLEDLARALAIPPETLKTAIPDQAHLLDAMAESALQVLLHRVTHCVTAVSCQCPIGQFEALADAYIEWACGHPYQFRMIGAMSAGQRDAHPHMLRCRQSLHDLMARILRRMKDMGLLDPEDDPDLLIAMSHTYAHGVISKMLSGDLARWAPGLDDQQAARALLRLFIDRCFRQKPLSTMSPRPAESRTIM